MTAHQEAHAHGITHRATDETLAKYRRGQIQHGGNLWEKGILFSATNAREEAIDQLTYTDGLMQELPKLRATLELALARVQATTCDDVLVGFLKEGLSLLDGRPQKPNT